MTYFFFPYLRDQAPSGSNEKNFKIDTVDLVAAELLEPMLKPRANFAAIWLNNMIYVYGGASGKSGTHHPELPSI